MNKNFIPVDFSSIEISAINLMVMIEVGLICRESITFDFSRNYAYSEEKHIFLIRVKGGYLICCGEEYKKKLEFYEKTFTTSKFNDFPRILPAYMLKDHLLLSDIICLMQKIIFPKSQENNTNILFAYFKIPILLQEYLTAILS